MKWPLDMSSGLYFLCLGNSADRLPVLAPEFNQSLMSLQSLMCCESTYSEIGAKKKNTQNVVLRTIIPEVQGSCGVDAIIQVVLKDFSDFSRFF